jgi:hypothetical protein
MQRVPAQSIAAIQSVEIIRPVRVLAVTAMNTFASNRHRPLEAPVTLSADRTTNLGNACSTSHAEGHMQKIKLFANYSIPVIWGVAGLVVGCVAFYLPVAIMWERIIVKPENITPSDGLTVILLSVIAGIFIGAAALFGSAQNRWTARH